MTLADDLRALIRSDERTDKQIADAAGIHAVNLSQFLAGTRPLSYPSLDKLAAVLGVEITVTKRGKKNSRRKA